jgi:hypothetical protein
MAQQIEIHEPDDETVEIKVNGNVIISANHDEHGWAGMALAINTAGRLGGALGVPVVRT